MENARFTVNVSIDPRVLHEVYLPHFKRTVDAGVASIMSAYNSVNGEWCGQNPDLLNGILKEQWPEPPEVQIITANPVPVEKVVSENVLGVLPRNVTFIADILTGRVGSPANYNEWVGWKNRDRGMQIMANEPLWSVDFATGEGTAQVAKID